MTHARGRLAAFVGPMMCMLGALVTIGCGDGTIAPLDATRVAAGTWGADGAGAIVTDSVMHVHIGCTFGDVLGIVTLDQSGAFDREGSFQPRAYPVAIGPSVPARFVGRVQGRTMTVTVTANDTIAKMERVFGPVTVTYDVEPRLGPCPICRVPGMTPPSPGFLERLRRAFRRSSGA